MRFTRNIAAIVMDTTTSRRTVNALGGADSSRCTTSGTDLRTVEVEPRSTLGVGGAGDGAADQVVVEGTNGPDGVKVSATATQVTSAGLAAQTLVTGSEPALDVLRINTLAGDDTVTVAAQVASLIQPVVDLGLDG